MNKSLVPKIRFKGFNDEWKKYKINEIYKLKRGCVISKEILFKNKETNFFPVYSSQTSNNGIMGWTNIYLFEKNKIIWTTDGANAGTIRFVSENFYASNVCGVLIGKKDHYNNYSFAIAISLEAKKHVNKNGNPKLMNNIMGNINFYNSKLKNEQTKIADFFTIIDRKIELIKKKLNLLEKQKQYYLNNMFANEKSYPKIRFKGFNDEWKIKKIKELGNIKTGKTPSTKNEKNWLNDVLWITIPDMTKKYLTNSKKKISLMASKKNPIVKEKSILFSCIGTIGNIGITTTITSFNQQINSISSIKDGVEYVYYLFQYNTEKIKSYSSAQTLPMINKNYFENIEIFVSLNYKEQTKIADFLSIIDRKIELIKEQLSLLKKQKQYYLNNMFI